MKKWLIAGLLASSVAVTPAAAQTKLLRDPAVSDNQIAFAYAGDIWVANPDGSNARRLTSHEADERDPVFSPDGSMIAFSANYDGNYDVFVVPASGGTPKRLTWHPSNDTASDFTPDGRSVVFSSSRETRSGRAGAIYTVPVAGGFPQKQSEMRSVGGTWSEDGEQFANVPGISGYNGLWGGTAGWRGYRGGTQPSIEVIDPDARTLREISGEGSTDFDPFWMDGQLYFLSDRDADKVFNVYRWNPADGAVSKVTDEPQWDVRNASGKNGRIVYEAGGELKEFTVATGAVRTLPIALNPDLPQRQAEWKNVAGNIESVAISPTAKRVAVTARGEVFTVPTDKGSTRNISASPSERNYGGIWSHDGTQLAYITDDGDGQVLVIEDQSGIKSPRRIALGPDFYDLIDWGGDGKYLIYSNNKLALSALDVATGTSWTVATTERRNGNFSATLHPDGRWLAFTTRGQVSNAALQLYDLTTRQTYPVTGEFADVGSPAFSKDGKLLFFTASTNAGPLAGGFDMTTQEKPYRAGIYAVVLEADGENPLAPVLANEEGESESKDKDETDVVVAPQNLRRRMISLPVAEQFYTSLATAKDGSLYYIALEQAGDRNDVPGATPQAGSQLYRFAFDEREASTVMSGITGMQIDAAGETLLLSKPGGQLMTAKAGAQLKPEPVDLSGLKLLVDPVEEWRQIFNDVWRMEKAYFYDPNMHGLDWAAVKRRYEPLLPYVGRREDLNELMVEMIGEMQVGHNRVGGGDVYTGGSSSPGLLGADIRLENGRYRITKIYDGEQWNPFLAAPLAAPGVDVKEGDYILAINGREVTPSDNIFEALSGSAGTQIALTVASTPSGARRTSVVEPVGNESALRLWSWVEDNRRYVDEKTDGRVAYVYMPNTADAGYTFFNRMYFAQTDKQALILDERSNGGGQGANYVIDVLRREYLAGWKDREGLAWSTPNSGIWGPKTMLIDQDAGSGGDFMPYAFRASGLGPLIGTRTWGGLIGISANPGLIDGGFLTVPFFRFFEPDGTWSIENEGTAPDMRVELDQLALDQGRDTQLDAAIEYIEAELERNPARDPNWTPPYPTQLGD